MSRAGYEPAIPMFERPKIVLALDRTVIETGERQNHLSKLYSILLNVFLERLTGFISTDSYVMELLQANFLYLKYRRTTEV
jgi:hypothetical protein